MITIRSALIACFSVVCVVTPASAQFPVIDPLAISKTVILIDRVLDQVDLLTTQLKRWEEVNANLPGMDRYKLDTIPIGSHDVGKYVFGAPLLRGLNGGDPRGVLWASVVDQIPRAKAVLASLPNGTARTTLEKSIAGIEISDSLAERSIHQVGIVRGFSAALARAIETLNSDVTHPRRAMHYPGVRLGVLSVAEYIGRNQDLVTNQLQSHILEQMIHESKFRRDADADSLNLHLTDIMLGRDAAAAVINGTGAQLRTWRQP